MVCFSLHSLMVYLLLINVILVQMPVSTVITLPVKFVCHHTILHQLENAVLAAVRV